jgi:hypothetical protein
MRRDAFEIDWSDPGWPSGSKRAARPHVEAAVDMAADGLSRFGIRNEQKVVVRVIRVPSTTGWDGQCNDKGALDLYLSCRDIDRRKVGRRIPGLAATTFHETVHCARSEPFPDYTLPELTATEGIAWAAERRFGATYLTPQQQAEQSFRITSRQRKNEGAILGALAQAAVTEQDDEDSPKVHAARLALFWHCPVDEVPDGAAVGILAVERLASRGTSLSDMIVMPAHEILGLPKAL